MTKDQSDKPPLKVLVVDDRPDNADSLSFLLEGRLCQTTAAYSAEEGLAAAINIKPDVVVLDLCMPQPNGIETCRRIREQAWATETIIVGVTGSWIAQEAAQRGGGFDGVFLKPGEVEPLRKLVTTLQAKKQRVDEPSSV